MDDDLGSISATVNAHTQSLNALREVQAVQGEQLKHIVTKVDNTELWMGHLNGRMDGVETRLGGVDEILSRLGKD